MLNPINQLKERIFSKKDKSKETELTNILDIAREFSCLGEIIGRDFEIKDSKGELLYKIHQKPMAIKQMNTLLKEFVTLKTLDNEREAAKWGDKGKGVPRLNRRGR